MPHVAGLLACYLHGGHGIRESSAKLHRSTGAKHNFSNNASTAEMLKQTQCKNHANLIEIAKQLHFVCLPRCKSSNKSNRIQCEMEMQQMTRRFFFASDASSRFHSKKCWLITFIRLQLLILNLILKNIIKSGRWKSIES